MRDVHDLVAHIEEMLTHQGLGEEVGNFFGGWHEGYTNLTFLDAFSDKEVTTVNVFGLRVMLRVVREVDGRHVIQSQRWGLRHVEPCLLYTSPSPRDKRQSRMPSSA